MKRNNSYKKQLVVSVRGEYVHILCKKLRMCTYLRSFYQIDTKNYFTFIIVLFYMIVTSTVMMMTIMS